jgi:NADH-quinone oxidoreductase subunit B
MHDGMLQGEKNSPQGLILTKLDQAINWARKSSLWPLSVGLACCGAEMAAMTAARSDLATLGADLFRASPRQADLMIIAGRVSWKMVPVLKNLYEQVPEPKWVIALGDCATSGGVFNNYAVVQGVDKILPVDVYVPGCPPGPEHLIQGIKLLQQKIQSETGTFTKLLNII